MLIPSIRLTEGYPIGREDPRRAWIRFNGSTRGALHRDPVWGDSRDPLVRARNRAEGYLQVFKLRERSCRRWQLKVCNQFYELFAARHAPPVLLPASKPGRPQGSGCLFYTSTGLSCAPALNACAVYDLF